jgi:Fic family protein
MYKPINLPSEFNFESTAILKKLAEARAALAELKGFVHTVPNQHILIKALSLQEAKDSSAIENIITTHDELFKAQLSKSLVKNTAIKEVENYSYALQKGVKSVSATQGLITNDCILAVQEHLERNNAGYRSLEGTVLKNEITGTIIYTPPQKKEEIEALMANLLEYVNIDNMHDIDPLIKTAIIHFQFESIHPFYDGNGRTGRILIILYLISKKYIEVPVLYLSRYIVQNKNEYYNYLQDVRDKNNWEQWVLYILEGIKVTSIDTIELIREIKLIMAEYKVFLRENFSFYSQDLLNSLFKHPYTKIEFIQKDLRVTRQTASKYLNSIADHNLGYLKYVQIGKFSYFVNIKLYKLFTSERSLMLTK